MRRPRWIGPYRLLYRIASGGMAEIYRGARTLADGQVVPVALKCILPLYTSDPDFIEMLKDEARTCGLLNHRHIARIYELGNVDEQCFLAMEFVDGMDLRTIVRRCRERGMDLLPAWALYVIESALRGLHAAHERDIVHRDFSPSNILVSFEGEVKLIDFGIAKAAHNKSQTRSGFIKGKVKYMSPEQTMGKRLDPRSDVFAAGVVLYEALTGFVPFHAPDDVSLMEAIRHQDPDRLPQHDPKLPAALDEVMARALAKDVGARFPTAAAFADALAPIWRELAPGFEPSELGAFLSRVFARERQEAQEQLSEYDLDLGPDDLTPTGERQSYTRLVAIEPFAEEAPPTDESLLDAVEEWLAARRAAQASVPPLDAAEALAAPDPNEVEPWVAASKPAWVEDTGRTLEMEALSLTGESEVRRAEAASKPPEGETKLYESESESTTTTRARDD